MTGGILVAMILGGLVLLMAAVWVAVGVFDLICWAMRGDSFGVSRDDEDMED